MKKQNLISRRMFLKGTGGAYLAIPFLPSLLPREAWGQAVTHPKRMIAFWNGNGTCVANWNPAVSPMTEIAPNVRSMPLSSISGNLSTILGPEISALRSKLLFIRGLDGMAGDGHNTEEILAGSKPLEGTSYTSQHVSIDQLMGASLKIYPKEPKTRVLCLAGQSRQENISFMKSGESIVRAPFMYDMRIAFETLFSDISDNPDDAEKLKVRNLSLVDRVYNDYKRVMGSTKISSVDKLRLDSHVSFIAELQKRINDSAVSSGCVKPAAGLAYPLRGVDPAQAGTADTYLANMFDIAVAALRCDLTRMITLVPWRQCQGYSFLGIGDAHAIAHGVNDADDAAVTALQQYFAKTFAVLLNKLDNVIEDTTDGSTLLDHTAVLWRQECTGNNIQNHKKIDLPVILAGGGKFLNTGRFVDYRTLGKKRRSYDHTFIGVPYNQMLVTLLNGFGLTPAEYESGGAGYGYYNTVAENNPYGLSDTTRRAPLFSLLK